MSYTSADLAAIRTAIAGGTLRVKFGDREQQFFSMAELLQAEERIASAIATTARPKQSLAVASKGF